MDKKHIKNDFILITVLLLIPLIALILFYIFQTPAGDNAVVVITVRGELYDKVSLNQDNVIEIKTELGTNQIEIKDGQVWMSYADCPDQLCVNHRAVSMTGGQIVCLPNQIVVSVESSGGSLDSISE